MALLGTHAGLGAVSLFLLGALALGCHQRAGAPDEDVASGADAITVCPGGPTTPGIDVSYYQGNIDWSAVAAGGYAFGVTRINDGSFSDPTFGANWAGIKAAGLVRGAYQFYEPTDSATDQANTAVAAVGMLGQGDLPVMLDVEWTSGSPNAADIGTWIDIVTQGTGKRPMIYTASGYWNQYFTTEFGDVDLWVANWSVSCPGLPSSWSSWSFWQTGGGGTPGISGDVDQDVYNGSLEDLLFYANANGTMNCASSEAGACAHFGCACADDACSGGFCPGSGCTAQHTQDCGNFGCQCVDGGCSGGFCPGPGCSAKEINDCGGFGCGCVDHQCSGGFCPGNGCTAKNVNDCAALGQDCSMGMCVPPGGGATTATTGASTSATTGAGGASNEATTGAGANAGDGGASEATTTTGAGARGPGATTGAGAHGATSTTGVGAHASSGDEGDASDGSDEPSGCSTAPGSSSSAAAWPAIAALLFAFARRARRAARAA